ncbi:hypothetical protein Tco_0545767 [Tanacetum coccineum]
MISLDTQYHARRSVYNWDLIVLRVFGLYTTRLLHVDILILMCLEERLESTQYRIAGSGEAMETFKRRRFKLGYRIQQLSKGSSEGSRIILEVPDESKDNSDSSSSSLSRSDDKVQDISSDDENKVDENKSDAEVAEKQAGDEHLG